ncbi:nuclear transport factor 2 family protein [Phenylobacterium sp. LjRoot219]|uniref:nuclear transport factor 2 family protein n=1 Tax=Phenylobacterium sp. LjRoot219 TaxID=3342283 RepID=UPI003ECC86DC
MDPIARVEAVEEIRNLKARYFRLMDTKQWDALVEVFTPDLKVLAPTGEVWLEGGPAFAASLRTSLENAVSQHQGFTAEIEITGADAATGVWAMQDVIAWEDRHPREGWKSIVGRGHYHETYRRIGGRWRIATLMLTRLSLDVVR